MAVGGAVVLAGCGSGSRAAAPTQAATATATLTPTSTPAPTATPDPLDRLPATAAEARAGLAAAVAADAGNDCPVSLRARWKAACVTGDLDGDGKPDRAFLVPLMPRVDTAPGGGVVFLQLARRGEFEEFPRPGLVADSSEIGRAAFAIADELGTGSEQLIFVARECGGSGCSSRVQVLRWDGSAWRDNGPGESIDNLDRPIEFDEAAGGVTLTLHGGKVTTPGAGPSRASTYAFALHNGRFELESRKPDAPVYLFHALQDADALFAEGDFADATAAYRALIANEALKDWRKESGEAEGRPSLEGYALFRIAIATAALGDPPEAAIDDVIAQSKEPLFVHGIEAFRRGYQERHTVQAGCAAATTYFTTVTAESDVPAYIRSMFFYGFANLPVIGPKDICPL